MRVGAELIELAGTAGRRRGADLLAETTMLAVRHLPGVDHAGITVLGEGRMLRSVGATDGHPLVLDNIQRRLAEGPCLSSAAEGRRHQVEDLGADSRWPAFAERALACTPVRAILSVPLVIGRDRCAALNLFADRPGGLDADAAATAEALARHVTRLTASCDSRRPTRSGVINQAKQQLMARHHVDVAQAFSMLVAMAKEQHESIEAVARELVAQDPAGEPDAVLP